MYYFWISLKMQFRVPIAIFFSLGFPIVLMVAMISSTGNFSIGDGYHFIDKYFLISTGVGLLPTALIGMPVSFGEGIQTGEYRRLHYFGIKVKHVIVAEVLSYMVLLLISQLCTMLFSDVVYGLKAPALSHIWAYVIQVLYCGGVYLILSAIIALLAKNTKILIPLGMTVLFITYIFTGVLSSYETLPVSFRRVGDLMPIKYVMNDFFKIWQGKILWDMTFLKVNSIVGVILLGILLIILRDKKEKTNV